jgi:hypothetical protein
MNRTDIINTLIKKINAQDYLEIGVSSGENFAQVSCTNKTGVDPELRSPATLHLTSDDFFATNTQTYDVIFVDGLHHADQVYRDIVNSLAVLNPGGYIVCHDMNPLKKEHQTIPFRNGHWNGDCWKAFVQLRTERDDLEMCVLDTDEGCAVIRPTDQPQPKLVLDQDLTFENLEKNRTQWLNLMAPAEYFPAGHHDPLQDMLLTFIHDPENPENSWQLALYYHGIGQTASAVSFYVRTAERTADTLLQYECMVRAGMCFDHQGIRKFSVKGMMQHAIALHPERPEAYYMLGKITSNERNDGNWFDSYTWSSLGMRAAENQVPALRTVVDYPGKHAIAIQRAASAWWCGLCDESRRQFLELNADPELPESLRSLVKTNLQMFNAFYTKKIANYTAEKFDDLVVKFPGASSIKTNYAESYQDMFVLSMLAGKRRGTYLEIGAGNAEYGNNSCLLEKDFAWTGVSIELDESLAKEFNIRRSNPCMLRDALSINYDSFISGVFEGDKVDYLQIDCDPAEVTYKILLNIPFEKYRFGVITYEHDYYADPTQDFRKKSRKLLESYGYVLVAGNISPDQLERPYEDWWVHPELVDADALQKLTQKSDDTKMAEKYMLGKI